MINTKKSIADRLKRLEKIIGGGGLALDSPIVDLFNLISETNGIKITQHNYVEIIWGDLDGTTKSAAGDTGNNKQTEEL